jgi:predicted tellurium resistance membrane protein TerC
MVVASSWIAKLLEKYPSIQWVGLFVILFTALHMLEKGFSKASMYAVGTDTIYGIPEQTIFTLLLVGIISLFAVLQTRYLRADRSAFATWAKEHGRILMITIFFLLILAIEFGAQISAYMSANHGYKYGFFMICVLGILEVLRLQEPSGRTGIVDRIFGKK